VNKKDFSPQSLRVYKYLLGHPELAAQLLTHPDPEIVRLSKLALKGDEE